VVLASADAARFLDDPAALFDGLAHDRNHHLLRAQRLAGDLLAADPIGWLRDFERSRLWPPLHAVAASLPMAASGLDYRTAVLPSLLGWIATCGFGFGCARRAFPGDGVAAGVAGVVAFVWIAASPAHHLYATDAMLESLGSGLTLACLFFFLGLLPPARDEARRARWLGLCLSLLFVEKYNYYGVAAAGLALAALQAAGRDGLRQAVAFAARGRPALRRELRRPWPWLAFALWLAALWLALFGSLFGDGSFQLLGRRVSLRSPETPLHLGYLVLLLRLAWLWRGRARSALAALPPPWRQLVAWHVLPVAVWFALPRRLGYFLHHVSPANRPPGSPDLLERWRGYADAFVGDYHAADVAALATLVGVLAAALSWRRLAAPARACLVFAGVAALATALHPNGQSRFLMSWIASVWVVAGVGAACIARAGSRLATAGLAAAVALHAGVLLWWGPPARIAEAPSVFAMTDAYRSELSGGPVAVVANHPCEELVEWRFVATGGRRADLQVYTPPRRATRPEREAHFRAWLSASPAPRLLFLDVGPESPWHAPGFGLYEELGAFVRAQVVFEPAAPPRPAGPGVRWQRFARPPDSTGRP